MRLIESSRVRFIWTEFEKGEVLYITKWKGDMKTSYDPWRMIESEGESLILVFIRILSGFDCIVVDGELMIYCFLTTNWNIGVGYLDWKSRE